MFIFVIPGSSNPLIHVMFAIVKNKKTLDNVTDYEHIYVIYLVLGIKTLQF